MASITSPAPKVSEITRSTTPSMTSLGRAGGGGAGDRVSFIDHEGGDIAFLISDAPTESSLDNYVKACPRPPPRGRLVGRHPRPANGCGGSLLTRRPRAGLSNRVFVRMRTDEPRPCRSSSGTT